MHKRNKLLPNQKHQVEDFLNSRKEAEPKKLTEHLKNINDSVISIVMTIIVLEIQAPEGPNTYPHFIHEISIFIITFLVIADFWYDLHQIFAYFITRPSKIDVIVDFLFLATMALVPVTAKWIMDQPSTFAVLNYGVAFFLANILKYLLELIGMNETFPHFKLTNDRIIKKALKHAGTILLLNLTIIAISFFNAQIGMFLYLAFPILTFIWPYQRLHRF